MKCSKFTVWLAKILSLSYRKGLPGFLLSAFLLVGCTTASTPSANHTIPSSKTRDASIDQPVVTRGCGHVPSQQPGTSINETLSVNPAEALGHSTRTYRLHIPTSYQENRPQALILVFHGAGGTATGIENGTKFSPFADQHDIVVVYPQGLPDGEGGGSFWASDGPMDYGIDDVHFVSTLLDDLQNRLCIDAHRIFVTGFSNGGGMSGLLACRLAGRLAAAAPVSGNFYAIPGGCQPTRPFPILDVHGSADPVLPYQGYQDPAWPLSSIPQWLQGWATRDGCHTGPTIFLHTSQVMAEQWSVCRANSAVVHYRVEGGGHAWPARLGENTSLAVLWNFFQEHSLP